MNFTITNSAITNTCEVVKEADCFQNIKFNPQQCINVISLMWDTWKTVNPDYSFSMCPT